MKQAVHGWLPTYERLVKSQNFFSSYLTQEDMSRFGRNYLQVGMYTEMLFPEYGVHFIAVNDGVDSVHGDSYPHGKIYPSSAVYRLTFPTLFCIVCMGGYLPALRLKSLRAVFAFTEVRK